MWWAVFVAFLSSFLMWFVIAGLRIRASFRGYSANLARRADQQQAWLDVGDPRGLYGDFMPPAMFLESERVEVKPSNDGTPLLSRAAVMIRRLEYIEKHWGSVQASIDRNFTVEIMAIQRFLDRCAKREGMTYEQLVDYVRSSSVYRFSSGDGSVPLGALDRREITSTG